MTTTVTKIPEILVEAVATCASAAVAGSATLEVSDTTKLTVGLLIIIDYGTAIEEKNTIAAGSRRLEAIARRLTGGAVTLTTPLLFNHSTNASITTPKVSSTTTTGIVNGTDDEGNNHMALIIGAIVFTLLVLSGGMFACFMMSAPKKGPTTEDVQLTQRLTAADPTADEQGLGQSRGNLPFGPGGQQSNFNQPQSGFDQPQSAFNQPQGQQSNFNQPQNGFNQPQSGFNQPTSGFPFPPGQQQMTSNFNQPASGAGDFGMAAAVGARPRAVDPNNPGYITWKEPAVMPPSWGNVPTSGVSVRPPKWGSVPTTTASQTPPSWGILPPQNTPALRPLGFNS
jgi:hypothetical protein